MNIEYECARCLASGVEIEEEEKDSHRWKQTDLVMAVEGAALAEELLVREVETVAEFVLSLREGA